MSRPDKARVRAAFERAAGTYAAATAVQQRVCRHLETALPADLAPRRILDAGCGTGFAVDLLAARFPQAEILTLDFSAAMLTHVPPAGRRLQADLEQLPLAAASIDLYWSSLAVQWCDFTRVLEEARRVLRPGGRLALATLGPRTFEEVRSAFATVDRHPHTLNFHAAAELNEIAGRLGFSLTSDHQQLETAFYPDFRALLGAVKAAGANQLGPGRRTALLGKTAFRRAEQTLESRRQAAGLPLTYDVITLHATR